MTSPTVLYLYMTDETGLSDRFYGYHQALPAAAAVVATAASGFSRRRTRFGVRRLMPRSGVTCDSPSMR